MWSGLFQHCVSENGDWVEDGNDTSVLVHAEDHGKVDEVLGVWNDDVEECLGDSKEERPCSGESPGFIKLLKLDGALEVSKF